ncbi:MAG: VIT domain-containing protein [Candidatus Brocadiia bacterium]|nr:VIT domain-containing protein [Candidatus Brocadiia bacterium]
MNARRMSMAAAVVAVFILCRAAGASGILLPKDQDLPPLGIKSHRVETTLKDGVATSKITQVFFNSTKRRLEATYIFPIPTEAALTDFAMYINGKRQSGQIVEARKARKIYQDIVRRMRDPGLLEYMDAQLLKLSIFPIEPESTQKIEITYAYPLPFENGVYRYTFPLKTGEKASRVIEDSTFSVEITDRRPVVNVYSPSHKIGVSHKGEHRAIAGFEEEGAMLSKDFVLYYTVGQKDFGLNLITHRVKGEDGFFALMLAPRVALKDDKVMPKDVCFLVDVSGSMQAENRIESAREAVKHCLKSLNKKDRFALVTFSTSLDVYGEGLTDATAKNVGEAVAYVDKLEATGGTLFCDAVLEGLKMAPEGKRPYIVVLLTDGKPTLGKIKEPDAIIEAVRQANKENIRVFTFGIAERLNVPLLDRIAETTRGYSQYVAPGREIEAEVSAFFRKVSHPVLSGPELSFGKVKVRDMYPQELPDLFRGSQLVAFGRYSGGGEIAVELSGVLKGKEKTFAYNADFPKESGENDFIPYLWAQRKIAYLLDEIRLHGESGELKDEVVRLSKGYGIATPYTSYLVLENADEYARHGIVNKRNARAAQEAAGSIARKQARGRGGRGGYGGRGGFGGGGGGGGYGGREGWSRRGEAGPGAPEAREDDPATFRLNKGPVPFESLAVGEDKELSGFVNGVRSGEGAVALSKALRRYKESDAAGQGIITDEEAVIRKIGERTFLRVYGVYVDTEFDADMKTLEIAWGSDAYFALLDATPDLVDSLMLGENVIVVIKGKALIISDEGNEDLSEEDIEAFFE